MSKKSSPAPIPDPQAEHDAHVAAFSHRDAPLIELDYEHYSQAAGSRNIPNQLADGTVVYAAVAPVQLESADGAHASAAADHNQEAPAESIDTEIPDTD